jgi:hypothetical protein
LRSSRCYKQVQTNKRARKEKKYIPGSFFVALSFRPNPSIKMGGTDQGCQIFLGPKYQNGEKYTELPQNIANGNKIFPMAAK